MTFSPDTIHDEIDAWLDAAAGHGLTADEARALESHLATCPDCLRAQQEYQTMSARLTETLEKEKPQPGFENRLVAGFRNGKAALPTRTAPLASLNGFWVWLLRLRIPQYGGALAGLAALVMTGALLTREPLTGARPAFGVGGLQQDELSAGKRSGLVSGRSDPATDAAEMNRAVRDSGSVLPAAPASPARGEFRFDYGENVASTPSVTVRSGETASKPAFEGQKSTLGFNGALGSYEPIPKPKDASITYGNQFQNMIPIYHTGILASSKVNDIVDVKGGKLEGWWSAPDAPQTEALKALPGTAASAPLPAAAPIAPPLAAPDTRKVIRNGHVEFEVEKFDAAVEAIDAAARAEGGFVDTKASGRGANGKVSGTVVARMLPDHLDAFLARIAGIGTLKTQRIEAEDVTKAYTDTDARLRSARKMEEQLLALLEKNNGKVSDLLQVEKELGRVRSEIEQMQSELKAYDGQLAYATVTIALAENDLSQAATFVVKESAEVALLASDVDKAFQGALDAVKAADGQVEESRLTRDEAGRVQGTLRFLAAPEKAESVLGRMKALGRVARFAKTDRQIAQGGSAPSDTATVKRDKVEIAVTLSHDEETRQTVILRVVAKDVAGLLAKAKEEAASRQGEILSSEMSQEAQGNAMAHLVVRVPADAFAALQDDFKALGRVASLQARRQDNGAPSPDADRAPVLLDLTLVDGEDPVQTAEIRVLTPEVEARAAALKKEAATAGAEVKNSTFTRTPGADETATLVFRIPLDRSKAFLDRIRAAGKVESFAERRQDRPGASAPEEGAPVEISLVLHNQGAAIPDENGLGATLRRTLGQGAGALMWSLRMIGVAVAFLAPWLVLAGFGLGGLLWLRRRAKK